MPKFLNGREIAGYIKESQARRVRSLRGKKIFPKLLILRDSENPVIEKYVNLKKNYGEDIGIVVEDCLCKNADELKKNIEAANKKTDINAMIVQLPLKNIEETDSVVEKIAPEKDVDGLSGRGDFDSATATAINWLLAGNNVDLSPETKIALVGRGRLVGAPLEKNFRNSGLAVTVFKKGDSLESLKAFDVVVTATGVPRLIKSEYLKRGAIVVDAGTASEDGVLKGDVDDEARRRDDLTITPKFGGVGPMTVAVLFANVIDAAERQAKTAERRQAETVER